MTLRFSTTRQFPEAATVSCIVVGLFDERRLSAAAARIDAASDGAIIRLLESNDLSGKSGAAQTLLGVAGVAAPRVLCVGLGEAQKFDAARYAHACTDAARALKGLPIGEAISYLTELDVPGKDAAWKLRTAALAADAQAYRYTATLKPREETATPEFSAIAFAADEDRATLEQATAIAEGVRFARELGNLPPNVCTPVYLAEQARKLAAGRDGVSCEVLDEIHMKALGMGALLGVAQGSDNPPRLITLRWNGTDESVRPYALVGKGVTFDSGGISIKPSNGMEEMKFDMCGAAGVLGAFLAVAKLKLAINLVCIVPAVENMPGGRAQRPSDVVKSMAGLTIEVLNTDAEGRLILCDALTFARRHEPQVIIDAATLTGACVVALGKHASGLMTNDEALAAELLQAGEATLDRAWRLPLWDDYQSQLDTGYADVANIGGKYAGAITAGCFLARFAEGLRWAHLDIAGTAWDEGRKGSATGRPVPLLVQYLLDRAGG